MLRRRNGQVTGEAGRGACISPLAPQKLSHAETKYSLCADCNVSQLQFASLRSHRRSLLRLGARLLPLGRSPFNLESVWRLESQSRFSSSTQHRTLPTSRLARSDRSNIWRLPIAHCRTLQTHHEYPKPAPRTCPQPCVLVLRYNAQLATTTTASGSTGRRIGRQSLYSRNSPTPQGKCS